MMKSKAKQFLEDIKALDIDTPVEIVKDEIDTNDIKKRMSSNLVRHGILNIDIEDVKYKEGSEKTNPSIVVTFKDLSKNKADVEFKQSEDTNRPFAICKNGEINLSALAPSYYNVKNGPLISLADHNVWLDKQTTMAIFNASGLDFKSESPSSVTQDAFGNKVQATPPLNNKPSESLETKKSPNKSFLSKMFN